MLRRLVAAVFDEPLDHRISEVSAPVDVQPPGPHPRRRRRLPPAVGPEFAGLQDVERPHQPVARLARQLGAQPVLDGDRRVGRIEPEPPHEPLRQRPPHVRGPHRDHAHHRTPGEKGEIALSGEKLNINFSGRLSGPQPGCQRPRRGGPRPPKRCACLDRPVRDGFVTRSRRTPDIPAPRVVAPRRRRADTGDMRPLGLACLLTLACRPLPGDTSASGGSDDTTTGDAPATTGTTEPELPEPVDAAEQHGYVCLRVALSSQRPPALPQADMGFTATLHYNDCLIALYAEYPDLNFEIGLAGASIFMDAADWLYSQLGVDAVFARFAGVWGHTVVGHTYGDDGPDGLWLNYVAPDPGAVDGGRLLLGPLPLQPLTGCVPAVSLPSPAAIASHDSSGAVVWQLESFPSGLLVPTRDAADCVDVTIAAPSG